MAPPRFAAALLLPLMLVCGPRLGVAVRSNAEELVALAMGEARPAERGSGSGAGRARRCVGRVAKFVFAASALAPHYTEANNHLRHREKGDESDEALEPLVVLGDGEAESVTGIYVPDEQAEATWKQWPGPQGDHAGDGEGPWIFKVADDDTVEISADGAAAAPDCDGEPCGAATLRVMSAAEMQEFVNQKPAAEAMKQILERLRQEMRVPGAPPEDIAKMMDDMDTDYIIEEEPAHQEVGPWPQMPRGMEFEEVDSEGEQKAPPSKMEPDPRLSTTVPEAQPPRTQPTPGSRAAPPGHASGRSWAAAPVRGEPESPGTRFEDEEEPDEMASSYPQEIVIMENGMLRVVSAKEIRDLVREAYEEMVTEAYEEIRRAAEDAMEASVTAAMGRHHGHQDKGEDGVEDEVAEEAAASLLEGQRTRQPTPLELRLVGTCGAA